MGTYRLLRVALLFSVMAILFGQGSVSPAFKVEQNVSLYASLFSANQLESPGYFHPHIHQAALLSQLNPRLNTPRGNSTVTERLGKASEPPRVLLWFAAVTGLLLTMILIPVLLRINRITASERSDEYHDATCYIALSIPARH